ncbi:unnamed protein product [Adineta steineri]|uniref:Uncharacterized protein n=1 Tax=Adineta steineri TaxID=433720 RepID=A0A814KM51_9BILA|nr:unnamed protein product [Adineta steineri]CAF1218742.1 unnamed protein product [Adineta steineri]
MPTNSNCKMFGTDHFGQLCRRRRGNGTIDIDLSEGERMVLNFMQQTFSNISQQQNFALAVISDLMEPPSTLIRSIGKNNI